MRFIVILVAGMMALTAHAEETVGEKMGKTAREVKDGVFQGVEDFSDMVKKVSKNVAESADDAAKGVQKFAKDVKEGYQNDEEGSK